MSYAATHARAYQTVARKGAPVTFSNPQSAVSFDSATDTAQAPPTLQLVPGVAIRDSDAERKAGRYESGSLTVTETPVLLFVPTTYGATVKPGATCTWSGTRYVVSDDGVVPIAPDGTWIAAHVSIGR